MKEGVGLSVNPFLFFRVNGDLDFAGIIKTQLGAGRPCIDGALDAVGRPWHPRLLNLRKLPHKGPEAGDGLHVDDFGIETTYGDVLIGESGGEWLIIYLQFKAQAVEHERGVIGILDAEFQVEELLKKFNLRGGDICNIDAGTLHACPHPGATRKAESEDDRAHAEYLPFHAWPPSHRFPKLYLKYLNR